MTAAPGAPATLGSAMQRLRLIAETRAAGASWADIGAGLKMSGKEAKRAVRLLERDSRRQFLVASQAEQGIAAPPVREHPVPAGPPTLTVLTDQELAAEVARSGATLAS